MVKRLLSGAGSAKETMHYELDISGSGLSYRVGDRFGVHPRNSVAAIDAVLNAGGLDGQEAVQWQGAAMSLRAALEGACLQNVGMDLVRSLAALPGAAGAPAAAAIAGGDAALSAFMRERHVAEALREQATDGLGGNREAESRDKSHQ